MKIAKELIPEDVLLICSSIKNNGHEAWIVGGAIRDVVLNRKTNDWDIATSATPEAICDIFKSYKTILVGIKYGTVVVVINNEEYEITSFRKEEDYNGRVPNKVEFVSSIKEDLSRRDITINAMAYDPIDGSFYDPYNGLKDINNKIIRTVGNPNDRFNEDALRVLRCVRFVSTLGFSLDDETKNAIPNSLNTYKSISPERIKEELVKIMKANTPSKSFQAMLDTGILSETIPELICLVDCAQNKYHEYDVWKHTMCCVDLLSPNDILLRFAALFHDIGKPQTKEDKDGSITFYDHEVIGAEITDKVLRRLKFSNDERDRIVHLVRYHYIRYDKGFSDRVIRRWVKKVGRENVESLCKLARADIGAKGNPEKIVDNLIDELEKKIIDLENEAPIISTTKALAINGFDIMSELNITSGKLVGEILKNLLDAVIDDPKLNTKENLLVLTKTFFKKT